ncbi:hypothetical protein BH24PSE2_BH24PSE2_04680 [soil metagenome]
MNPFEFVIAVVLIMAIAGLIKHRDKQRFQSREAAPELDAKLKRIEDLEHRVQVLEKIVTDRNYDLRRQFEDLEQ